MVKDLYVGAADSESRILLLQVLVQCFGSGWFSLVCEPNVVQLSGTPFGDVII